MSYCLLVEGQVVEEGDTLELHIEGVEMNASKMKVIEIDPKSQSFTVRLDLYDSIIDIPISCFGNASIIENKKLSDPNILFKFHHVNI